MTAALRYVKAAFYQWGRWWSLRWEFFKVWLRLKGAL